MRPPQGFEWLLILFIVVLLFGSKRLPDVARGVGRSLRILKAETRGLADDETAAAETAAAVPPLVVAEQPVVVEPATAEKPLS